MDKHGIKAELRQGTVEALPYQDAFFDSLVNTMAFTAYPDGRQAMSEMHRVLKPGGRIVMVDINFPKDANRLGMMNAKMWAALGDVLRDMGPLFQESGFEYSEKEAGGFGSIHLCIARKR